MEDAYPAALTPDQLAAIAAGGGYARCEDPKTHVVYHLVKQGDAPMIDDDYVRAKLQEAYDDIEKNGLQPLNMAEIRAEFQRRLQGKTKSAT
ncbi:MAG TPA: hypothetical protein VGI75_08265 [Pirellulales bacterium]|jgi:hypothetical protein